MSHVTERELFNELFCAKGEEFSKIADIEIVPRRMVEMIIEECERNKKINYTYGNYCAADNLKYIVEYAKSLLKKFEGGEE